MKPYYITTAIDYTNAPPHIGHAYEKVLADVMARFQRLNGREVYFLTGVDQHGQKVQKSAEKAGLTPQEFVDGVTTHFTALWDKLNVRFDGWAATTDIKHKRVVQAMLQKLHDCGQLYKKSYGGFYSVRQEQFLTDKERGPDGEFGPEGPMARATKRVCRDCGFMVPLAGALGAMFGVCCNEMSADGHVVDFLYGCGAHSDTPAPHGAGSPAYEPFDDGVLDVVEGEPAVELVVEAVTVEVVELPEPEPVDES